MYMKVTVDHRQVAAKNIITFYFKPERPVRYTAGQFIELYLPHDTEDARGHKRWFTLSSAPEDNLLSITTKFSERSSSFKKTLRELQPGTELKMVSPMGDFVLPKNKAIPLLFVAGGIGCTPYHSMIKHLQNTGEKRDLKLLYAARSEEEIAFGEDFEKLGDNFITLVGEPLTTEKILETAGDNENLHIYLSGPEPMVEKFDKELKEKGFGENRIHGDFFPNYTEY